MAAVNEGFVGDEDTKKSEVESPRSLAQPQAIISTEIDYSKAKYGPIIGASLSATMGAYILGCFIGWGSPCQPQLQQNSTLVTVTDPESIWYVELTTSEMSWVSALINLGAMVGALVGGLLMDRLGRKTTLILMAVPAALGWALICLTVDPSMLYIGRLVGGFSGGVCCVVAPSYVGEIAIPSIRGVLGFFFQLMVVLGILITSLLGLGLDWRWISAICAIDPLIFLVAMIFMPESPYYLVKKGRADDAKQALKWFRGPEYNIEPEMAAMQVRVRMELAQSSRFSDLFKPWALKPMIAAIFLMVFQQLSGINAALFNAVFIFEAAKSTLDPLICAVLLNADQVAFTLISSQLVDRLGRRTLLIVSNATMCVAMVALGAFFFVLETDEEAAGSLGWLPLTSLILFIAAFAIGAGPIPWMMFGEILPAKVKGPGASAASFTNWFLAFIITLTFVDIQEAMTPAGAFWMFGGFLVIAVLFSVFILPETKGKTPEDIQRHFGITVAVENVEQPRLTASSDKV